jgi:uncharacterized protein YaeQ
VAAGATVHAVEVELADVDRHVYETLALRVARHPSETAESVVARVLAYALEYAEGIAFGPGLAEPDAPALAVRDLTGGLRAWIDVGAPDAERLHRASKAAPRVAVYTHKDPGPWLRGLAGARIHRADALELYALDRELVGALAERLEKRVAWGVSVTEGHLYVTAGGRTFEGAVTRLAREG